MNKALLFHLEPNAAWTILGLFAALAVASLVTFFITRGSEKKSHVELRLRVQSWWYILILFAGALAARPSMSLTFFALVAFLGLKEYYSLIPIRQADRRIVFWGYAAIPFQFLWIYLGWYDLFIIFIPVFLSLFIPFRMVTIGETQGFVRAASTLQWGLMAIVFSIGHLAYLLALPPEKNPVAGGAGLVLFVTILTELNDVFQFVWGKTLGRHKVIPKVSPNKTWEGLVGGVLTTSVLAMVLAPVLTPIVFPWSGLAGLLIGIVGFFGDVVMSALKRDIGVKDSGSLIPGHGGILDRIDSLTFTAPIFFHLIRFIYY